jgi:CRISPR-associated endonuclease/helicase Cas3
MDSKGIINSVESGKKSFNLPFRDIEEKMRIIDDYTTTVYILAEAPDLENRIRGGERSRELFRKLNKYCISLQSTDIKNLDSLGALEHLDDELILLSPIYYDKNYGAELSPKGGQGLFL